MSILIIIIKIHNIYNKKTYFSAIEITSGSPSFCPFVIGENAIRRIPWSAYVTSSCIYVWIVQLDKALVCQTCVGLCCEYFNNNNKDS